jgi:hypothetical protein
MLLIVCGLPGAGKTVVAKKIAKKIGAVLLRTDVIRKKIIKKPTYSKEEKLRVYDNMFSVARKLLQNREAVILDATFAEKSNRQQAKKIAKETGLEFEIIEVKCSSEKIIKERLQKRFKDESDAKYEHYLKYKKIFEPITEKHIIIDNFDKLGKIDNQINNFF